MLNTMGKPVERVMLRLSPELHQQIKRMADEDDRSVNAQIQFMLRRLVELASADHHSRAFRENARALGATLAPLMSDQEADVTIADLTNAILDAVREPSEGQP